MDVMLREFRRRDPAAGKSDGKAIGLLNCTSTEVKAFFEYLYAGRECSSRCVKAVQLWCGRDF